MRFSHRLQRKYSPILLISCLAFSCTFLALKLCNAANITGANFESNQLVTIRGKLTNVNGRALSGVRVDCVDQGDQSITFAQTDTLGNYSIIVATGGTYTVQPNDARVETWEPEQVDLPVLTADANNINFFANFPSFVVSGTVKNSSGTVLPNAHITAVGPSTVDYLTNSNGAYTSDQLNILGDYRFTPKPFTFGGLTYNTFTPAEYNFVSMLTCDQVNPPPGVLCSGFNYADVNFTATAGPIQVRVQTNPAGLNVSIDGGPATPSPVDVQWQQGSSHTIATTSSQNGSAGTRFVFNNWSDTGAISHSVNAPNVNTTYTANFTTQYQLTMSAGAGGTVLPASGSFFNSGQGVQISASPNTGFVFSGWTGTGTGAFTGSTNPVIVTMNGPITEAASFSTANTIQFSLGNYSAAENGTQLTATVTRGNSTGTTTVDYASSDAAGANLCSVINGAASSRCDYLTTLGTLNFAAGESSKTITIPIIDDVYAEGTETFTLSLSNPTGATLGAPATATLTINDNDATNGVNPINSATFFVRQHYVDFLNREPDASGLNFWTNEITSCGSDPQCIEVKRINVSAAFFLSIEFQQTGYLVYRFYKTGLGNLTGAPVPVAFTGFLKDTQQIGKGVQVGVGNWEAQLEANKQAYALAFVQRSDFQAAFPISMTADQFVTKLDTNAGGVLSTGEKTSLVGVLGATPSDLTKRASVLRSVAEDEDLRAAELNKAFVLMQYFGYLRRSPNDLPDSNFDGFTFWLGKLNSFGGNFVNAEMVKAFILSAEYKQRFGP